MDMIKLNRNKLWLRLITFAVIIVFLCQNIAWAKEDTNKTCLASKSIFKLFEKKGRTLKEAFDTEDRLFALREMILRGKMDIGELEEKDKQVANEEFIDKIRLSYHVWQEESDGGEYVYLMRGNIYKDKYGNEQVILFYPKDKVPWKLLRERYGLRTEKDAEYAKRGFWIAPFRYESFELSLAKAMENKVFNALLDVKEDLELVSHDPCGDEHAYFTIHEIDVTPDCAKVKISYLRKDDEGYGVEVFREFSFEGDFRQNLGELYRKIDGEYFDIMKENNRGRDFFLNQTRTVILKGCSSGKEYKVYYKFGKAIGIEVLASEILEELNLGSANIYEAPDRSHIWLKQIKAETVSDFIDKYSVDPKSYNRTLSIDPPVNYKNLFANMGRAVAVMFILGNEDLSCENMLSDSNQRVYAIDNEMLGSVAFYGMDMLDEFRGQNDYDQVIMRFLNIAIRNIFSVLDHHQIHIPVRGIPQELRRSFLDGIKTTFEEFVESSEKMDMIEQIISEYRDGLYSRVLLRASGDYHPLLPIPHYCVETSAKTLTELFHDRLDKVRAFIEKYDLLVEDSPHFSLEKREKQRHDGNEASQGALLQSSKSEVSLADEVFECHVSDMLKNVHAVQQSTFMETIDLFKKQSTPPKTKRRITASNRQIIDYLKQDFMDNLGFEIALLRVRGTNEWIMVKGEEKEIYFNFEDMPIYLFDLYIHNHHGEPFAIPSPKDVSAAINIIGATTISLIRGEKGLTMFDSHRLAELGGNVTEINETYTAKVFRLGDKAQDKAPDGVKRYSDYVQYWDQELRALEKQGSFDRSTLPWTEQSIGDVFGEIEFKLSDLFSSTDPVIRMKAVDLFYEIYQSYKSKAGFNVKSLNALTVFAKDPEIQIQDDILNKMNKEAGKIRDGILTAFLDSEFILVKARASLMLNPVIDPDMEEYKALEKLQDEPGISERTRFQRKYLFNENLIAAINVARTISIKDKADVGELFLLNFIQRLKKLGSIRSGDDDLLVELAEHFRKKWVLPSCEEELTNAWDIFGDEIESHRTQLNNAGVIAYEFLANTRQNLVIRVETDKVKGFIMFLQYEGRFQCRYFKEEDLLGNEEGWDRFIGNNKAALVARNPKDILIILEDIAYNRQISKPLRPLKFDDVRSQEWIDADPENREIRRKMVKFFRDSYVSFEEFCMQLDRTVGALDPVLDHDEDYMVVYDTNAGRSKRWVYELAKRNLKRKPKLGIYTAGTPELVRDIKDNMIHTFVFFDDALYSGTQTLGVIESLCKEYGKWSIRREEVKIIIAIPFISEYSEQRIQSLREEGYNIKVLPHITFRRIQEEEGTDLDEEDIDKAGFKSFAHALSFDHKKPDDFSLDPQLKALARGDERTPYSRQTHYLIREKLECAEQNYRDYSIGELQEILERERKFRPSLILEIEHVIRVKQGFVKPLTLWIKERDKGPDEGGDSSPDVSKKDNPRDPVAAFLSLPLCNSWQKISPDVLESEAVDCRQWSLLRKLGDRSEEIIKMIEAQEASVYIFNKTGAGEEAPLVFRHGKDLYVRKDLEDFLDEEYGEEGRQFVLAELYHDLVGHDSRDIVRGMPNAEIIEEFYAFMVGELRILLGFELPPSSELSAKSLKSGLEKVLTDENISKLHSIRKMVIDKIKTGAILADATEVDNILESIAALKEIPEGKRAVALIKIIAQSYGYLIEDEKADNLFESVVKFILSNEYLKRDDIFRNRILTAKEEGYFDSMFGESVVIEDVENVGDLHCLYSIDKAEEILKSGIKIGCRLYFRYYKKEGDEVIEVKDEFEYYWYDVDDDDPTAIAANMKDGRHRHQKGQDVFTRDPEDMYEATLWAFNGYTIDLTKSMIDRGIVTDSAKIITFRGESGTNYKIVYKPYETVRIEKKVLEIYKMLGLPHYKINVLMDSIYGEYGFVEYIEHDLGGEKDRVHVRQAHFRPGTFACPAIEQLGKILAMAYVLGNIDITPDNIIGEYSSGNIFHLDHEAPFQVYGGKDRSEYLAWMLYDLNRGISGDSWDLNDEKSFKEGFISQIMVMLENEQLLLRKLEDLKGLYYRNILTGTVHYEFACYGHVPFYSVRMGDSTFLEDVIERISHLKNILLTGRLGHYPIIRKIDGDELVKARNDVVKSTTKRFVGAINNDSVKNKHIILAWDNDIGIEENHRGLLTDLELNKQLGNIHFISARGSELKDKIDDEKKMMGKGMNVDVIVISKENNVSNDLKDTERTYVIEVNDEEITEEMYLPILEILTFSIGIVYGRDNYTEIATLYSEITNTSLSEEQYEELRRDLITGSNRSILLDLPPVKPISIEKLGEIYQLTKEFLQSA